MRSFAGSTNRYYGASVGGMTFQALEAMLIVAYDLEFCMFVKSLEYVTLFQVVAACVVDWAFGPGS